MFLLYATELNIGLNRGCQLTTRATMCVTDKLLIQMDPGLYFFINQGCLTVDNMNDQEEMEICDVSSLYFRLGVRDSVFEAEAKPLTRSPMSNCSSNNGLDHEKYNLQHLIA